jgi:hypothetical protein
MLALLLSLSVATRSYCEVVMYCGTELSRQNYQYFFGSLITLAESQLDVGIYILAHYHYHVNSTQKPVFLAPSSTILMKNVRYYMQFEPMVFSGFFGSFSRRGGAARGWGGRAFPKYVRTIFKIQHIFEIRKQSCPQPPQAAVRSYGIFGAKISWRF